MICFNKIKLKRIDYKRFRKSDHKKHGTPEVRTQIRVHRSLVITIVHKEKLNYKYNCICDSTQYC